MIAHRLLRRRFYIGGGGFGGRFDLGAVGVLGGKEACRVGRDAAVEAVTKLHVLVDRVDHPQAVHDAPRLVVEAVVFAVAKRFPVHQAARAQALDAEAASAFQKAKSASRPKGW